MEVSRYYDVMVDVETGGLDPSHSPMIQLAAVKFNLAERTIDTSSMFNRCLLIPPGRFWDEGTRNWWGQQKRSILEYIYANMEDPKTVMQEFVDWVGYSGDEPLRFWAKPTTFDWNFVASYMNQFELTSPFHFRFATDMNSYIRGMARDASVPTFENHDMVGDAHNALHDVIYQIDTLFKASDHYAR